MMFIHVNSLVTRATSGRYLSFGLLLIQCSRITKSEVCLYALVFQSRPTQIPVDSSHVLAWKDPGRNFAQIHTENGENQV